MREGGAPFSAPPWRGDEVGLVADEHTDDRELAALVVTSYRLRAPRALAALVPPPG